MSLVKEQNLFTNTFIGDVVFRNNKRLYTHRCKWCHKHFLRDMRAFFPVLCPMCEKKGIR